MAFLLADDQLKAVLLSVETALQQSPKIKFQRLGKWRREEVPDFPGVYVLFEQQQGTLYQPIYVGETGNLRERMADICRTVNHTFRRQLATIRFSGKKTKGRFDSNIERLLDDFFDQRLFVSFIKANFGRSEIESFLVEKYRPTLLNSETRRKLKLPFPDVACCPTTINK